MDLCRRSVDFVGQYQIVEQGAALERETAVLGAEDLSTGKVCWQQVRRELDSVKVAGNAVAEHLDRPGFGQSWCAFHQQVTIRQKCNKQAVDQLLLADDLAADMLFEVL